MARKAARGAAAVAEAETVNAPMDAPDEATFQWLDAERVIESPLNPRKKYDDEAMASLTASIERSGIITPLIARPIDGDRWELAAGHRRLRAAKALGLRRLPVIVRPYTDMALLEALTIENLQRADVDPLDEADGYKALLATGTYDVAGLAAKVGKSEAYIYQRMRLTELSADARKLYDGGTLTIGHILPIARQTPDGQAAAVAYVKEQMRGFHRDEKREAPSVVELRGWIQNRLHLPLKKAPFDTTDVTLSLAAGACDVCPKNSATQRALFGDIPAGECTDRACYATKEEAALERIAAAAAVPGGLPVHWLTSAYQAEREDQGHKPPLLPSEKWKRAGGQSCDHLAIGVLARHVYGGEKEKIGDTFKICTEPRACKVHNPSTGRLPAHEGGGVRPSKRPNNPNAKVRVAHREAYDKEENGRRLTAALVAGVVAKSTKPTDAVVTVAALGLIREMWADNRKAIVQRRGWMPDKPAKRDVGLPDYNDWDGILRKHCLAMKPADRIGLLVELAIARGTYNESFSSESDYKLLALPTVATTVKVKVDKIKREVAAGIRTERKEWDAAEVRRASRAKTTTKATGKDGGKRPAKKPAARKGGKS